MINTIVKYTCVVVLVYSYLVTGAYTSTKYLTKRILAKDEVAVVTQETSDQSVTISVKASRNHTAREKTKLRILSDSIIPHGNILVFEECGYLHSCENFSHTELLSQYFPKPRDPPVA